MHNLVSRAAAAAVAAANAIGNDNNADGVTAAKGTGTPSPGTIPEHNEHGHHGSGHMEQVGHSGMTFNTALRQQVLFEWWVADGAIEMGLTCSTLFLIAYLFQRFKSYRVQEDARLSQLVDRDTRSFHPYQVRRALLHGIEYFVGMTLMVVFMSMNVFIITALCLGSATGLYYSTSLSKHSRRHEIPVYTTHN